MGVDVVAVIAAGKTLRDGFGVLRGLAREWKNVDAERVLLDLQGQMNDLNAAVNQLRGENEELRRVAKLRADLLFDPETSAYWRGAEGGREGPFCPKCFDKDSIAARMLDRSGFTVIMCHTCDHQIHRPGCPKPMPRQRSEGWLP